MRLNPAKCAFRVQSGKFLGYMITQRGIEVNPKKIQAILDMEPPTSTKEVQRLTGRMEALGRFLSKSAERELSFLRTLRAGKNKVEENKQTEWLLFVDGASSSQGGGAGIVLVSLEGETLEYSLRFAFPSTNNVAEYEALIAGMMIVRKLEVTRLVAHSDSQLIVQQFQGQYEAREQIMAQCLRKVKDLAQTFQSFQLTQINRSLNGHADALSKLASTREAIRKAVFVEMLHQPSIEEKKVLCIEIGVDWRSPFYRYLTSNELLDDPQEV
ncbi:uncharacterized protein LOC127791585 [Diospyros lotus]|uniref:uncharacterized protein LOC127791585 n=1 Tax=Diospyros lotus TaxID=55363 RepID=UPI002255F668|nr:uncharacterized protein LOC127791585 [Diospyros lotus]